MLSTYVIFQQDALAERQLALLEKEISSKQKTGPQDPVIKRFVKGFGSPTGYKPLFILFFLFFFQQFAGIYITIFYAVTFFEVSFRLSLCGFEFSSEGGLTQSTIIVRIN